MENTWSWESSNDEIKKRTLSLGIDFVHPFDGFLCKAKLIDVKVENDERLPDIPPNGTEWEIIIGEGDTYFDRIVGRLLQTMLKLEVSEFRIKFGNAICLLRIQLVDFFPPPIHIYHMSEEQKLSEAERLKLRASDLIKENRFEDANAFLNRAFRCVCWAGGNLEERGFSELYFATVANLSLCSLKLDRYERTVILCSRLLKYRPNHVKCLLRRATCYDFLQETEKAKRDILSALAIEPKNKSAEQLLEKIKIHQAKEKMEYSALVKKMLQVDKK